MPGSRQGSWLMAARYRVLVWLAALWPVDPGHPGRYPGRAGGLWLWRTLVLSLFHAVVVPSGFRTNVQPHR
jgi:hypothetical protein